MSRELPEWVGKTDDTKVPPNVRLRIFRREDGICHLTGVKIQTGDVWQLDHKKALIEGGRHAESNLFPALAEPHKAKSAEEVGRRAKADAVAKKHLGINDPSANPLEGPCFRKTTKPAFVSRHPVLDRRSLFEKATA